MEVEMAVQFCLLLVVEMVVVLASVVVLLLALVEGKNFAVLCWWLWVEVVQARTLVTVEVEEVPCVVVVEPHHLITLVEEPCQAGQSWHLAIWLVAIAGHWVEVELPEASSKECLHISQPLTGHWLKHVEQSFFQT